ncbi:MAG: hypothetical protein ABH864_05640 [archaeon]
MLKRRSIAFAAFAIVVLSLSFVAARPFLIDSRTVSGLPQLSLPGLLKSYDFRSEIDIDAYQCRLGPFPDDFPDEVSSEGCNRQFLDITHDDRLDWADEDAVGGDSWTNYAMHHFFVLKDVNKTLLKGFTAGYTTYNGYHDLEEHHFFYVRDFQNRAWVLIGDVVVDRHEQGYMKAGETDKDVIETYVSPDGEMWFMGTEGYGAGKAIGSDSFSAVLRYPESIAILKGK